MGTDDIEKNDEPLELVRICGSTEAEMIAEMLRNNGIESTLQGDLSANAIPATGELDEVRVWVSREDAARAREMVDDFFTPVEKGELGEGDPSLGV